MLITFNPFITGAEVPKQKPVFHKKIDLMKLDHALDFIFNPAFHQVSINCFVCIMQFFAIMYLNVMINLYQVMQIKVSLMISLCVWQLSVSAKIIMILSNQNHWQNDTLIYSFQLNSLSAIQ